MALLRGLDGVPWASSLVLYCVDPDPTTRKRNKDLLQILEVDKIPCIYTKGRKYVGKQAFELVQQWIDMAQGRQAPQQQQQRPQGPPPQQQQQRPQGLPPPQNTRVNATGALPQQGKPSGDPTDLSMLNSNTDIAGGMAMFDPSLYGDTSDGPPSTIPAMQGHDIGRGTNTRTAMPPLGSGGEVEGNELDAFLQAREAELDIHKKRTSPY